MQAFVKEKLEFLPLVQEIIKQKISSPEELEKIKRKFAKLNDTSLPKTSSILAVYREAIERGVFEPSSSFERLFKLKKTRTLSGVVPVAIFTKPYPCPGHCLYCPTQDGIPKSYVDDEPAVMRARSCNFDPKMQIENRLRQYENIGHPTEKIELIVMGATFSAYPRSYRENFIKKVFDSCNQTKSENLAQSQEKNERALHRIVGAEIETRPDLTDIDEVKFLRKLGVTRVAIGVQTVFDDVLKIVHRGHTVQETIYATKILKDAGLKVCYHMMPNLPGSSLKKDKKLFEILFKKPDFQPDMLKIYPCVVVYDSELYQWWKQGKHLPYSDEELIDLLVEIKKKLPFYVRVNRLGRDIPVGNIAAGNKVSNIREVVQREMEQRGLQCRCVRCREIRGKDLQEKIKLRRTDFEASGGKEIFLEMIDKDENLYALLRLRIPSQFFSGQKHFLAELENSALIREVHTYGVSLPVDHKDVAYPQHQGLGKKLIAEAEKITRGEFNLKKIAVTSGVGVRDYYRKLGYRLDRSYMVKIF